MADKDKENRRWFGASIEEEDWNALNKLATSIGKPLWVVAEMAIQAFIVQRVNNADREKEYTDPDIESRKLLLESRAKKARINVARQLSYDYLDSEDEETYDNLQRACDLAGVDIDEILENAKGKDHVRAYLSEHGDVTDAEMWLLENLEPGKICPVKIIHTLGAAEGFKVHTLKRAKREIGAESVRIGGAWAWRLPKKEEQK